MLISLSWCANSRGKFIPLEDVKKAALYRVPKKFLDENMKAVQLGLHAAAKLLG